MLSEAKHLETWYWEPEEKPEILRFAQDDNCLVGRPSVVLPVHRFPLKSPRKIRVNPRAGRSVCITCANFTKPIAVENWGFSTADVTPHVACACVTLAG